MAMDPFHVMVLSIQREEKCSFPKAAYLAEERDPEAYAAYVRRNTRGTSEFNARQASIRGAEGPAPRAAGMTATMAKILEMRQNNKTAATAQGKKITNAQADQKTWEEFPNLYLAYLRENTRSPQTRQLGGRVHEAAGVNKAGTDTWATILLIDADGRPVETISQRIGMLVPFFAKLLGYGVASAAPKIDGLPTDPNAAFWEGFQNKAAQRGLLPFPDPGEVTK